MHQVRICSLSLALLLMLGCSAAEDSGTSASAAVFQNAPVAANELLQTNHASLAALDVEDLRTRAVQALRAESMYAPAGRNAVEFYLALRDKTPDEPDIQSALIDMQPYVLMASEQAIASSRLDEARRLIALLARIDNATPALPRLQQSLAAVEATLAADALLKAQDAGAPVAAKALEPQAEARDSQQTVREKVRAPDASATTATVLPGLAAPDADATRPAPIAAAPTGLAASMPPDTRVAAIPAPTAPTSATPDALPRLLKDVAPRYPVIALSRRVQGSVEVSFTIGADGSVSGARAVASRPARVFDQAALTAVSQWRFEATGKSMTTTRTVNFSLDEQG